MGVHAGGKAFLGVLLEGVGGHGQDGDDLGVRAVQGANGPGGGQTVHLRHHDIHEDGVKGIRWVGLEGFDGLSAVVNDGHLSAFLCQENFCDLGVEFVVVCQQEMQPIQAG